MWNHLIETKKTKTMRWKGRNPNENINLFLHNFQIAAKYLKLNGVNRRHLNELRTENGKRLWYRFRTQILRHFTALSIRYSKLKIWITANNWYPVTSNNENTDSYKKQQKKVCWLKVQEIQFSLGNDNSKRTRPRCTERTAIKNIFCNKLLWAYYWLDKTNINKTGCPTSSWSLHFQLTSQ